MGLLPGFEETLTVGHSPQADTGDVRKKWQTLTVSGAPPPSRGYTHGVEAEHHFLGPTHLPASTPVVATLMQHADGVVGRLLLGEDSV